MNTLNERIGELYVTVYALQDGSLSLVDDGTSTGGYVMQSKFADEIIEKQEV